MNELFDFEDIRPYTDIETCKQLAEFANSSVFIDCIQRYLPVWSRDTIREKLLSCQGSEDFMQVFFGNAIPLMLDKCCHSFTVKGQELLHADQGALFLSNHRDILLDAALLQIVLYNIDFPLTEISLGDNLMMTPDITRFAKLNKMFVVHRAPERREAIYRFNQLSAYLRDLIVNKQNSAWLAHREGRSKTGRDETQRSLIKMLLLSGEGSAWERLKSLNIVIQTLSYAYEPCDVQKVYETNCQGAYEKAPLEDLMHIQEGFESYKGGIHIHLEPLDCGVFDKSLKSAQLVNEVCAYLDQRMAHNFQLFYTHYIAYDVLHERSEFTGYYTVEQREEFLNYLGKKSDHYGEDRRCVYEGLLRLYAAAVENRFERGFGAAPIEVKAFDYHRKSQV